MKQKKRSGSQAWLRAELILKVQTGQLTATEAARRLGVSRKTYYQWEKRGLKGMMEALSDKPPGRPARPKDQEKEALKMRASSLEKELCALEESRRIRQLMEDIRFPPRKGRTKKKK